MSKCNQLYNMYLAATSAMAPHTKPIIFSVVTEDYPSGNQARRCEFTNDQVHHSTRASKDEGEHFSQIIRDLASNTDDYTLQTVAQLTEQNPHTQCKRTTDLVIHSVIRVNINPKLTPYPMYVNKQTV
jgi:hypothetical protein